MTAYLTSAAQDYLDNLPPTADKGADYVTAVKQFGPAQADLMFPEDAPPPPTGNGWPED
jgi:hypothetical protein